jgi:hypothetical protein
MDDDMLQDAILPKLQKEDIMLDFVQIAEIADAATANGRSNGAALTAANDGLALIDQVHAGSAT